MIPRPHLIPAAVLAFALAAAIGAAHADSVPRATPPGWVCADLDARQAARLAYAEAKLGLTNAQKDEFQRLGETLKAAHQPMIALCQDSATASTSLPARLEHQQKLAEAHLDGLKRAIPALTRFYQTLTPAQQTIADQVLAFPGGHGPGVHVGPGRMGGEPRPAR